MRIIDKFYDDYPEYKDINIIGIPSAGYAGTQFEGFMKALYYIVRSVPMEREKNNKINIITSQLSPADTRYLKKLLESFAIDYILLPDLSENLDGGHQTVYQRLPQAGTDIRDIKKMAGARLTLELSAFVDHKNSAAQYLKETYGVPYIRCNLPVSLRDNDEFIKILSDISETKIPIDIIKERERFLDAMIDAHKYSGEVRAAIYGEPDFVISTVRLCVENGMMPMIAATGSKCQKLKEQVEQEIQSVAETYFINEYKVIDEVDFQTIEEFARELKINLLIGNSDGRRMAEKLEIPLVRRSFPIHDRMGGQRLRNLGYEGALTLLDDISNEILSKKETEFRDKLYEEYFKGTSSKSLVPQSGGMEANMSMDKTTIEDKTMEDKTATHPCYNCQAHKYARMHLPIAPKCNISCNYCLRKYDCPNESRPGVTTSILTPEEAFLKFKEVKSKIPNLSVVGIAGPGDALANFEETKKVLTLIREQDKDITFCLSTNGLMLPQYVDELSDLGVSHITVTLNAIDPAIGARIYKYIDFMGTRYYGETAAAILLANQLTGIKRLKSLGIICKVNIVMLKGINDHHIPDVVAKVKELGGIITNIMQLIPVKGSAFEELALVTNKEVMEMRNKCGEIMKQMYHCRQCRADAIGTLDRDQSIEFDKSQHDGEMNNISKSENEGQLHMAVASKSGMIVDQHFGQVSEFYVYEYSKGCAVFKEIRKVDKYCSGAENCDDVDKIEKIIQTISDCNVVIAMRIGSAPKEKLNQKGIKTFITYDRIEDSVIRAGNEMNHIQ